MAGKSPDDPSALRPYLESIVGSAMQLAGEGMGLDPDQQSSGAVFKLFAGALATAAGRVYTFISETRARRVEEVAEAAKETLDAAGEGHRFVKLADLLEKAAPLIETAECRERRHLLTEILVNAAYRSDDLATYAEAMEAMRVIGEMPPEALALFAYVAANSPKRPTLDAMIEAPSTEEAEEHWGEYVQGLRDSGAPKSDAPPMPGHLVRRAQLHLYFEKEPLFYQDEAERADPGSQEAISDTRSDFYHLSDYGYWLRDWIRQNPLSVKTEEGESE